MAEDTIYPMHVASDFLMHSGAKKLRYYRGHWYEHQNTHWHQVHDLYVQRAVMHHAVQNFSPREGSYKFVDETVKTLQALCFLSADQTAPFWSALQRGPVLALRDGLLDLTEVLKGGQPKLLPFSLNYFNFGFADYDFDATATCPKFEEFLDWFCCGDADLRTLVLEIMCYCVLVDLQFQRFFWFTGAGANGKSTLFQVLLQLVGGSNVSQVPLERLGSRFGPVSLVGKHVNLVFDASEYGDRVSEGFLKQLSSGDSVNVEQKYKPSYMARIKARLIFGSNSQPFYKDSSDGMYWRLLLIPCNAKVDRAQRVNEYENVLCTELAGILNLVLSVAPALVARGEFSEPAVVADAGQQCRIDSNPTRDYLESVLEVDPTGTHDVIGSSLYSDYKEWMETRGNRVYQYARFCKELHAVFSGAKRIPLRNHQGKKYSVYRYIKHYSLSVMQPADGKGSMDDRRFLGAVEKLEQENSFLQSSLSSVRATLRRREERSEFGPAKRVIPSGPTPEVLARAVADFKKTLNQPSIQTPEDKVKDDAEFQAFLDELNAENPDSPPIVLPSPGLES